MDIVKLAMKSIAGAATVEALKADVEATRVILPRSAKHGLVFERTYYRVEALGAVFPVH